MINTVIINQIKQKVIVTIINSCLMLLTHDFIIFKETIYHKKKYGNYL